MHWLPSPLKARSDLNTESHWKVTNGTKACVPPNDLPTDKKFGQLFLTIKIGWFFHRFFFKLSVSFVCENRWKPTDLVVTPKDLPTDKITKIGGCLLLLSISKYIYLSKSFKLKIWLCFLHQGVIGPKYTQYFENAFAGLCSITIMAQIFGNL